MTGAARPIVLALVLTTTAAAVRLTPPSPSGSWRAGAAIDPAGAPLPDAETLRRAYDFAGLPRAGETVAIRGTRTCIATEACTDVTWRATTLGAIEGGRRLADDFHLPRATRAFLGAGPNPRAPITLIAPARDRLWAVVPLCPAPAGSECRNGYQPWEPAGR